MGKLYVKDVLDVARRWIGYKEKASNSQLEDFDANAGSGNWTIFGKMLHQYGFYNGNKNGYDWCTQFVDACLLEASGWDAERTKAALCYTGPYGASCTYSVNYYKAAGAWHKTGPQPGDQIFFGTASNIKHTGLVEAVDENTVRTIEGNSANMVRRRIYQIDDANIFGYGRPAYDGYEYVPEFPFVDVPDGKYYTEAAKWAWENGLLA